MKTIAPKNRIAYLSDAIGFSASTLCAIHCAILPFVISFLPLLALEFLSKPKLEWAILSVSIALALTSFIVGYYKHHHDIEAIMIMALAIAFFVNGRLHDLPTLFEEICTPIGGITMAYAHYRNWKLCKLRKCKICKTDKE